MADSHCLRFNVVLRATVLSFMIMNSATISNAIDDDCLEFVGKVPAEFDPRVRASAVESFQRNEKHIKFVERGFKNRFDVSGDGPDFDMVDDWLTTIHLVEAKPSDQTARYDDKARGLRLTIPADWSATPVFYSVQHYRDVFLCINSKGDKSLRVTNKDSRYDLEKTVEQLAPGTAYIDIAYFEGPRDKRTTAKRPDTVKSDLRTLLKKTKFSKAADGKLSMLQLSFIKNDHRWHLYAYLHEPVTETVRQQMRELLRSIQFTDVSKRGSE